MAAPLPPWIMRGPRRTREELASTCGDPVKANPSVPVAVRVRVEPVAFVKSRKVEETLLAERFVEETEAKVDCPVTVRVATWKFPLPVAFVKVMPVEEM